MLVLSILILLIAFVSALLSLSTQEEIVKVALGCTAVLLTFLSLLVAPWPLKLALISIPLVLDKLSNWSTEKTTN